MQKQQSQFQIPREYLWALIKYRVDGREYWFSDGIEYCPEKGIKYTCRVISNDLIKDFFDQFYVCVDVL